MRQITIFNKNFKLFIPFKNIKKAIKNIAYCINTDYKNTEPPLFISVLNGSFMFAGDLLKQLKISCNITFIKVASYLNDKSTGEIKKLIGLNENLEGKHIILLDDIVDSGLTMEYILEKLHEQKPASIKIAVLFFKKEAFQKNIHIDYIGMDVPKKFLVGYGMDYNGFGRNYKDLYILEENSKQ